jgi:hypothetical protein
MSASPSSVTTSTRFPEEQPVPERRTVLFALRRLLRVRRRAVEHEPLVMDRARTSPTISHMHPFV